MSRAVEEKAQAPFRIKSVDRPFALLGSGRLEDPEHPV